MNIFILCAGNHTRWGDTYPPKQLVPIAGEPLLARTNRMLAARGKHAINIITTNEASAIIANALGAYETRIIAPTCHTVSTVLSTALWWDNRTIILLGDVLYSGRALNQILAMDCIAAGTHQELFALQWKPKQRGRVLLKLLDVVQDAELYGSPGKLFNFYRAWNNKPLEQDYFGDDYLFIEDNWTRDFDTLQSYEFFISQCKRGLVEP